jgi:hypothetical protein
MKGLFGQGDVIASPGSWFCFGLLEPGFGQLLATTDYEHIQVYPTLPHE